MKRSHLSSIVILAALTAAPSFAAKQKPAEVINPVRTVTVEIPKSQLNMVQVAQEESFSQNSQLEISASSWAPNAFHTDSAVVGNTAFAPSKMPQLSLSWISRMGSVRDLAIKVGVGILPVSRSGMVGVGSLAHSEEQAAYLASLRAGLEYRGSSRVLSVISPYASAALLPTAVVVPRSAFGDGATTLGLPFELDAGIRADLSAIAARTELAVGFMMTLGNVGNSSFYGTGVHAGLRYSLN